MATIDLTLFFSTSGTAQSFLDFPLEVRNRIYDLAIFDHDREAVYLPRAVPRKVSSDTDLDIEEHHEDLNENDGLTRLLFYPGNEGSSLASGKWTEGPPPQPETVSELDSDSDMSEGEDDVGKVLFPGYGNLDRAEAALEPFDSDDCHNPDGRLVCYCSCHEEPDLDYVDSGDGEESEDDDSEVGNAGDQGAVEEDGGEEDAGEEDAGEDDADEEDAGDKDIAEGEAGEVDAGEETRASVDAVEPREIHDRRSCPGAVEGPDEELDPCICPCHGDPADSEPEDDNVPEECINGECQDKDCQNCVSVEPGNESDEAVELRDLEEHVGMLYEPREPSILLACKQIRQECLAIYYGINSFSWRFSSLDYETSTTRFKAWAKQLRDQDVGLIRHLTLEGRHTVEIGVDFDTDINLLRDSPYFEIDVHHSDMMHDKGGRELYDEALGRITSGLEHEVLAKLWKLSRSGKREVQLTTAAIESLGEVFVKHMQWYVLHQ